MASPARRRLNLYTLGVWAVGAVVAFALIRVATRHLLLTDIEIAALLGVLPIGLAYGIAELIAPSAFIRWRARMIAGNAPWQKAVGDYFDKRLAINEAEGADHSARGRRRVRALGGVQVALYLALGAAIIWASAWLDTLYRAMFRVH